MEGFGVSGDIWGQPDDVSILTTLNGQGQISLPSEGDFLRADFTRAGPDLLLQTPDGNAYIVPDYFMAETPVALSTADGAVLSAQLVTTLAGPQVLGQYAQDGAILHPDLGEPIGQVNEAEGSVTATHPDGSQVTLITGGSIFQGDVLETGAGSNVSIIFVDDTVFTLGEDGRMVMDEMVYDPGTQTGAFNAQVVQGVFSFVSGKIAKTSPDGMMVHTPTATIGIRGSTVLGEAAAEGAKNTITLTHDVDGNVGEIIISSGGQSLTLNSAGATTTVFSAGTAPTAIVILSQADIQQNFGSSLSKLVKVVAQKAQRDAKQAEDKAQKSEDEAKQADEEADKAKDEAGKAQKDADAAKAEADKAKEDLQAAEKEIADAKAAAEEAGDKEALARAEAAEAKLIEAAAKVAQLENQAKAEAKAAADAKIAADAKAVEAATKATEAKAAQAQAEQAQQFSSMADTAVKVQTQAFAQAQQNQANDSQANKANEANKADTSNKTQDRNQNNDNNNNDDDQKAKDDAAKKLLEDAKPKPPKDDPIETPNADPVLSAMNVNSHEDQTISGAIIGSDADKDTITYSLGTGPANGRLILHADGTFTYTPKANFNGVDSFTVTGSDGNGGTATSTVTISVAAVNDAPVLNNLTVAGSEDTVISGAVTGADADNDTIAYTLGSGPANGSVSVNADGTFTYTPTANFNGSDSFTVTGNDGNGGTATSTVTVNVAAVNDVPVLNNLTVSGSEDTAISGTITGTDVDNDTIAYTLGTGPANGGVTVNADGTFTYTPTANFNGTDSFTVTGNDGNGGTATSTVTVNVAAVNDAPVADGTLNDVVLLGDEVIFQTSHLNATDVDNANAGLIYTVGAVPTTGSVQLNNVALTSGATFTQADVDAGNVKFVQDGTNVTSDTFTYTVSDGTLTTAAQTFTMDISDTAILAGPSADYTFSFAASGVLTLTDTVGGDGTQTLNQIPNLSFMDGAITVANQAAALQVSTSTTTTTPIPGANGSSGVMMLENGNTLSYWSFKQASDAFTDMKAQLFNPAGQPIGVEFQLNDAAAANAGSWQETYAPKFAALAGGGFVATWHSFEQPGDLSTWAVVARYFDASGTPTTGEILVNTYTFSQQSDPVVTQLGNGEVLFTWVHIEPTTQSQYDIHAQRMDSGGNKIGAEFTVNTTDVNNDVSTQRLPDITALNNGGYAIVWDSSNNDGSGNATMLRLYNHDDTPLTGEILVNQTTASWQEYPHVASLNNGNIAVVWQGAVNGGFGYDVALRIFDSTGTAVTNEAIVNATVSVDQGAPQIAALDGGGFVVVWHSNQNAGVHDVYAQIYDANGAKVGTEFMVNNANALYDLNAAVTGTFDGGFIITWEASPNTAAINGDIISKRFDANGNELGYTQLTGDAANNTFNINPGTSIISIDGTGGTDVVNLGGVTGLTNIISAINVETITGANARDLVMIGNTLNDSLTIDLGGGIDGVKLADGGNTNTFTNVEEILGGSGADNITIATTFTTSDKAHFDGMGGVDVLNLTAGNDVFGAQNFETINGGAGTDTLASFDGINISGVALNSVENVFVDADNNSAAGITLSDTTIFSGATTILGTGGNDSLHSNDGMNLTNVSLNTIGSITIDADAATANTVGAVLTVGATTFTNAGPIQINGSGDDFIQLNGNQLDLSNATLTGVAAIKGSTNNDTITGSGGNDTIIGGAGGDTILGGAGADIFLYTATNEGGAAGDLIWDFTQGTDSLQFQASAFTGTATAVGASLAGADFSTSTTLTSGTYFVYNTTQNVLYWDADGAGAGTTSVAIAMLDNDSNFGTTFTLTAADITMV